MIAGGLFVILVVACAGGLVLRYLIRMRQMFDPGYALRIAQACGRDVGRETTFGPVSVHAFGADAPISMLNTQWEICRSRFESLVGEPLEVDRPLRVFVFGKRDSFNAFFRWAFLYASNLDGMFVPWSTATIAMTTEFPAHRLADLERLVRALMTYFSLHCYRKSPSPFWVQTGIANVIATAGDESESACLNRKVLAALSRGDSLGTADFFDVSPRSLVKLVRDWQDFDSFSRYSQLIAQSRSVVEFLCSEPRRRERFCAFSGGPKQEIAHRGALPTPFCSRL